MDALGYQFRHGLDRKLYGRRRRWVREFAGSAWTFDDTAEDSGNTGPDLSEARLVAHRHGQEALDAEQGYEAVFERGAGHEGRCHGYAERGSRV